MKQTSRSRVHSTLLALAALASFAASAQADGRLEINQASVDLGGGFPFNISASGSYVLTSDLDVPANTDAITLTANDVKIDLNGFTIASTFDCSSGSCGAGVGAGIRSTSVAFGRHSVVRNGTVRGFASNCVGLGNGGRIEALSVRDCGRIGISASSGGVVVGNTVSETGQEGLFVLNSSYSQNAISEAGLGGGGHFAITGGAAAGGNYCADGSCSRDGKKMFYKTKEPHNGAQALAACDLGYHMASLWEIFETSALHYDRARGFSDSDSQGGPPTFDSGWVRTGLPTNIFGSTSGSANCSLWTSSAAGEDGSVVFLSSNWNLVDGRLVQPWVAGTNECSSGVTLVWCVQD